ncbi:MAG: heterodisulfide reductase-related iron-sulfur binding cluster [Acidobacteriota bacterium]|nr:heterodisulfide reductase-related iron-sulfur binding cluster [Acidobacteriota bacterium]
MQHSIDKLPLGESAEAMTRAVEGCVHCGFCLPVCPTYRELGEEMDSPRGRIFLMKEALEGSISFADAAPYVDRCLGCLACEPACPSGVEYHRLLHPYRELASGAGESWLDRLRQRLMHAVMPSPRLFRAALGLARWSAPLAPMVPARWRHMLQWAGETTVPPIDPLPELVPASGSLRARVGLLTGCVQSVLAPSIAVATARVLARNGVDVVIPRSQGCCGSLALHEGRLGEARRHAGRLVDRLPADVDLWVTTAAGCGSGIAEYADLFAGRGGAGVAVAFAERVIDAHVFLADLGWAEQPSLPSATRVAYQDACHLLHAQGIADPPRDLLRSVGDLELVEIGDDGACCGSAGTYNLQQPELAAELGRSKGAAILAREPAAVVSGNIGCIVQIGRALRQAGSAVPVLHTMELLDAAYRGEFDRLRAQS